MSKKRPRGPFSKAPGRPVGSRDLWRAGLARPPKRWLRYRACCVGPVIAEARIAAEVSAEELAARLDVCVDSVHKWERGYNVPRLEHLVAIAAVLGTRVADLVAGCDP